MNNFRPPTEIAEQPSGNTKEVTWFRKLLKNVRERTVTVGPGLRCSYTMEGTRIELAKQQAVAGAASSGGVKRLMLWGVGSIGTGATGDYYTTYEEDGSGNFSVVGPNVAVPFFYRSSTYDLGGSGANYTGGMKFDVVGSEIRVIGAASDDYLVKVLFPAYALLQIIYAARVDVGTDIYATAPNLDRVMWVDITPRSLITVPRDYSVCRVEAGVPTTRAALIDGGPIH